jgi:hypothetical protein
MKFDKDASVVLYYIGRTRQTRLLTQKMNNYLFLFIYDDASRKFSLVDKGRQ